MKKFFLPCSRKIRNKDVMRLSLTDSPIYISLHGDIYTCSLECVHGRIILSDKSPVAIINEVKNLYRSLFYINDDNISNLIFIFI